MFRKRSAKLVALAMALVLSVGAFAGCAKDKGNTAGVEQVIRYNLGAEPKTLDPSLNSAVEAGSVIINLFEGLMRTDAKDQPIPGVAEKYTVSPDGLKYTFTLRKDAKWTDGKAVTAKDFEYSWKRALAPETAAEYAYQMFYLKNGEKYNAGEAKADEVGVKAVNDTTLEVTLEYAAPYFLSLMAFPCYMPLREDVVAGNDTWATNPKTYISNGAFKLTQWSPKDKIVIEKNENWWNAKTVKLAKVEMRLLDDQTAYLQAFRSGQLDFIESPPSAEIPDMLKSGEATANPYIGTYYYVLNVSDKLKDQGAEVQKALSNVKVRKALAMAINRKDIVEKVTKAGQVPATTFVPGGMPVDTKGTMFKTTDFYKAEGSIEDAKKLLAEAGYPNGTGFPEMTLMYNTSKGHQDIATAVQEMWKQNLGINVKLENQEWAVFQTTRKEKQYQVARHGWIGDYVDPMTFLDMWTSKSAQNDAGWVNKDYDAKIDAARRETDAAKRIASLRDAEKILMEEMPIIPIYYYTNITAIKPNIKGVVKSQLGFVHFEGSYVEKAAAK